MQVTSPTSRGTRGRRPGPLSAAARPVLVAALLLGLLFGLSPSAAAEDLKDDRDKVRESLVEAKQEIAADKQAVAAAEQELESSESALDKARSELAYAKRKLAETRDADAAVAADLARAEEEFDDAAAAALAAQADVERQRSLVGAVVRTNYQQHSDLQGLGLVLGASSAAELAQRAQWAATIFDSTTSQLDRLERLESQLVAARTELADAEGELIRKREASAAQLRRVRELTADIAAREAKLAGMVAANRKQKAEASDELAASQQEYEALERQEARITALLRKDRYNASNDGGFIKPVDAPAGSPFGMRYHPILHYWRMHWGTDFGASCGAPLRAMADGKVVSAGWTTSGFGNYTIISYGRMFGAQLASGYAHQSRITVKAGQKVEQGQIVGYVGTTGLSTGCHLHLQMYRNGVRVNPMRYL